MSVDPPEDSERLRRRLECGFTFLSDPEGAALDRLNIRHRGGRHDGADIAFPAQVLVDEGGIVRWTYQTDSIRRRARPEAIFAAIDSMRR